jgi:hypothetical protein
MYPGSFKEEVKHRGWIKRFDKVATHLLMNGGVLSVPDHENAKFLNVFFAALLRHEAVSVVEQKTPVFRLFFDIDAKYPGHKYTEDIKQSEASLVTWLYKHILEFFDVKDRTETHRMIVCSAPVKQLIVDGVDLIKCGMHVYLPEIYTNSKIALALRTKLLDTPPPEMTVMPDNIWSDVIDEAVFKGSGLRTIYSHKGISEARVYRPRWVVTGNGHIEELPEELEPEVQRDMIHECSIRTFHHTLTPTVSGEHMVADQEDVHVEGGRAVQGRSTSIHKYTEALPGLMKRLPAPYRNISFVRAFVSTHAVYLKSTCKYCMNVGREHNTSTIYVQVTKQGASIRCYCRKEEYKCADYTSAPTSLPREILQVFFPEVGTSAFLPDVQYERKSTKNKQQSESVRFLADRCFAGTRSKRKKKRF